jgi:eukaryotic-like serine/threonine-protein kinase
VEVPIGRAGGLVPTRIERQMDEVCDRFETAWREGDRPLIEDFLGATTGLERPALLRHLLDLELVYRGGFGESPVPSEYRIRFPGNDVLIDSIFAEFAHQTKVVRGGNLETVAWAGWDGARSGAPTNPPPDYLRNVPGIAILSELGRGGMGVVYKARQIRLNRLCALKVTLPGERKGAEFRARFLAEAETIAKLRHTNIRPPDLGAV